MNEKLRGIIIPAVTVFDADDAVDVAAMEHNFGLWGATEVAGYMVLGTNGEFKNLNDDEARQVVEVAARCKADKALIVGAGRESTYNTIEFINSLAPWHDQIDYVSLITPHYFPKLMDDAALRDYYTTVADISPVPVMIYVIPAQANGVSMSPSLLAELAAHPNIHGAKDTSGSLMADYMAAAGGRSDFAILAGSLSNIMIALDAGGLGGVVSAANYLPAECARLTDLYFNVSPEAARDYYVVLSQVAKSGGGLRSVTSVKAAMNARGYQAGAPRRPIQPVTAEMDAEVRQALDQGLAELENYEA